MRFFATHRTHLFLNSFFLGGGGGGGPPYETYRDASLKVLANRSPLVILFEVFNFSCEHSTCFISDSQLFLVRYGSTIYR